VQNADYLNDIRENEENWSFDEPLEKIDCKFSGAG
jgi:hypothetical protein